MIRNRSAAGGALVAAVVVCALAAIGCERQASAPAPKAKSPGEKPTPAPTEQPAVQGEVHTYTVRARVVELPDPSKPTAPVVLHHEAIDNFVRRDGSLGMNAMEMPFPLAPGVSVSDLKVEDPVEVVFTVQWQPRMVMQVTKITKLPADTELHFGPAKPAGQQPSTPP